MRPRRIVALTLSKGQSHIIVGLGDFGWSSSHHYVIATNGVKWSAALDPMPKLPVEERFTTWSNKDMRVMPPEMRLPLLWAKKALRKKAPGTVVTTDAAATKIADAHAFGPEPTDRVTLLGYAKRKLAHSIPTLIGMFTESVNRCQAVWGWRPINPEVEIHTTSRAMGLAFGPGRGRHRISLHIRLLTMYDLASIQRVVLHELCHHYRNERFAENRYNDHDEIFCRELQRVDTTLSVDAEKRGLTAMKVCSAFYEQQDVAVIEDRQKKYRKNAIPPVWAPQAGTVMVAHLKSGRFRFSWEPNAGNKWTVKVDPFSDVTLLALAKHFDPKQLDQVAVVAKRDPATGRPMWPQHHSEPPPNLLGLLQWALKVYLRFLPQTAAYVADVIAVHTKASA